MDEKANEEAIRNKYKWLVGAMNERMRRLWAAAEAKALGRGGVTLVAQATGLSRTTITAGIRELDQPSDTADQTENLVPQRSRRLGGGRNHLQTNDPTLIRDLELLVDPYTRGDPMSPLRWTCKSTRQLALALQNQGHKVCHQTVSTLLRGLDYSLQANRKTLEGKDHKDRNAQFEFINHQIIDSRERKQPAISVDTKKKENLRL